MAGSVEG